MTVLCIEFGFHEMINLWPVLDIVKNKYLPAASATSAPTTAPILLSSKVDILYQRETRIWKKP